MFHSPLKVVGETVETTLPSSGPVSFVLPHGVKIKPYLNDIPVEMHHIHAAAGDRLKVQLLSHSNMPSSITVSYDGKEHSLHVTPSSEKLSAISPYTDITQYVAPKSSSESVTMTPAETINLFANPGMTAGSGVAGGMGAGLGAGLVGGLLGTALFRPGALGYGVDGNVGDKTASNISTVGASLVRKPAARRKQALSKIQ